MPRATTQRDSAKWTPSIINATVQRGQVRGEQLGQYGLGHRHELARDRRLTCRRRCFSHRPARARPGGGGSTGWRAPFPSPSCHGERLGRVVPQLPGPVRGPHGPVVGTRRPLRGTDPRSRPCRTAARTWSCLPRSGQGSHVGIHHRCFPAVRRPRPTRADLLHVPSDLGHRHSDLLRNPGHGRVHELVLATLHGDPCCRSSWRNARDTYHTAGLERGTAPQLLRDPARPPTPALDDQSHRGALFVQTDNQVSILSTNAWTSGNDLDMVPGAVIASYQRRCRRAPGTSWKERV